MSVSIKYDDGNCPWKILFKGPKRLTSELIQVLWGCIWCPAKKGYITLSNANNFLSLDHDWIVHALIYGLAYFCCGSVGSYYVSSVLRDNIFCTIRRPSVLPFGLHAFIHSWNLVLFGFLLAHFGLQVWSFSWYKVLWGWRNNSSLRYMAICHSIIIGFDIGRCQLWSILLSMEDITFRPVYIASHLDWHCLLSFDSICDWVCCGWPSGVLFIL